jgi:ADP-ribose pyrophosphatase YjhB (NUDIX family)
VSISSYSGKLRVRTGALIFRRKSVLLVKQYVPTLQKDVWLLPGGGVEFGEKLEEALKREVKEETLLDIETEKLQFVHEYYQNEHHAMEFYFHCIPNGEEPELGKDPEHDYSSQALVDVKYISLDKLNQFDLFPVFLKTELPLLTIRKEPIKFFSTWQ